MAKDQKPHIAILGRRNVGKSTLINALTGQDIAIVSPVAGTTTDPVRRSVELLGVGPVVLVDTAGVDDLGDLGALRVGRTLQVLGQVDLALVLFAGDAYGAPERELAARLRDARVPMVPVCSKTDIAPPRPGALRDAQADARRAPVLFSNHPADAQAAARVADAIKEALGATAYTPPPMLDGLVAEGDLALLVTPIDAEAPAGRLILPQVQAIRDILDHHAAALVAQPQQVPALLAAGVKPRIAVCDSQVFGEIAAVVPPEIPLTGFSVLLARQKGDFEAYRRGTPQIANLKDGDRVLVLESCSHQVGCGDIGREKIPAWMRARTGRRLDFDVVAGLDLAPRPITDYALVVQCGGCMITPRQLRQRLAPAAEAGVPVTNYGMAIAFLRGQWQRAMAPFEQTAPGAPGNGEKR